MAKSQFIKKGKFLAAHHTDGGSSDTKFEFSANEAGRVTIKATLDYDDTHIVIEKEIMDCSVKYLIEWLQNQVVKLGKWAD